MMRRLYWYTAILLMAGSASMYLAAQYVEQHPESGLGRSAVAVYQLGMECNPLCQAEKNLAKFNIFENNPEQGSRPTVAVIEDTTSPPNDSADSPWKPEEPRKMFAPVEAPALPDEKLNLIQTRALVAGEAKEQPGSVITPEEAAREAFGNAYPANDSVVAPEEAAAAAEKSNAECRDGCPPIMPYCNDEKGEPPAIMSYIDDAAAEGKALLGFCKGIMEKVANYARSVTSPNPEADDSEHEDSDSSPEEEATQDEPEHYQTCPECPQTGIVVCPYTGRSYPVEPKTEPKPAKEASEGEESEPHKQGQAPCHPGREVEDRPSHPEVDTMEFRPSDARKGEFDPKPM